jgi:predicted DNA-binding transcriptional regulator AlpA
MSEPRSIAPAHADDDEVGRLKAERLEAKRVARRNRLKQSGFPIFVRYDDLVAAGFVASWTQLLRMIDDEGFPAGTMLSANVRAWRLDEVEAWLAARPTARKTVPPDAVHPRVRDKRRAAAEAQPNDA